MSHPTAMESQSQLARDAELMAKELENSSNVTGSDVVSNGVEGNAQFGNYGGDSIGVTGDMLSSFSNDMTAPNSNERLNDYSTRNLTPTRVHSWDEFHQALVSNSFPGISPLLPNLRRYSTSELPWNSLLSLLLSILEDNKAKTGRLGALQSTLSDTAKTIMDLEKQLSSGNGGNTVIVRDLEKKVRDLEAELRRTKQSAADESLVEQEKEVERQRTEQETSREQKQERKDDSFDWRNKCIAAQEQLARERREMEELKKHTKKVEGDLKQALDQVVTTRLELTSGAHERALSQQPDAAEWSLAKQTIAGLRLDLEKTKETESTLKVCLQRAAAAENEVEVLRSQLEHSERDRAELTRDVKRYQSVQIKQSQEDLSDIPALLTNRDVAAEVQVLRENVLSMRKGLEVQKQEKDVAANEAAGERSVLQRTIVELQEELRQRPLHSDYDNARKIAIDAQSHATDSYLAHQHSSSQLQTQLDECVGKIRALERDNEVLREALKGRSSNSDLGSFMEELKAQLEQLRSSSQEDATMYQNMIDELQDKLGQAEQAKNKLQKQLNERPSKEEVLSLRDKQLLLEKEVAGLRESKKKQEEYAEERAQELLAAKQRAEAQAEETRKLIAGRPTREEFNAMESEAMDHKKKVDELETKVEQQEQALAEQSDRAEKTRSSLEDELMRRNEDAQAVESLKSRLNHCGTLEAQLMEARRQIVKLTEDLTTLRQKYASCPKPEDLVSAESKINRLENEIDSIIRSKEVKDTENDIIINSLHEKVADLEKKLQQVRTELATRPSSVEWRDKKAEMAATREAFANEKLLQVQQIARSEAECNAALSRVKYLESENKSLVRELNARPSVEEHEAIRAEIRSIQNKMIDDIVDQSPVKKKGPTSLNQEEYVQNVNALKEHVDILQRALEERPSVQQWEQMKMKQVVLEDQLAQVRTQAQSIEAQARSDAQVAKETLLEMQKRAEHAETLIKILEKRPSEEMLGKANKEVERLSKLVKASQHIETALQSVREQVRELEKRPSLEQWQEASELLQTLQSQLMNSDGEKRTALNNADTALATREEALRLLEVAKEELHKAAEAKREQNHKIDSTIGQLHDEIARLKRQVAELHEKNVTQEVKLGVLPSTEQWVRAQALLASMSSGETRAEQEKLQLTQDINKLKQQLSECKRVIQQMQERADNAPTIDDLAMAETVVQKLRAEVSTLQHNCAQRTKEAEGARQAFYELKKVVESGVATTSTSTSSAPSSVKPSEAFFVPVGGNNSSSNSEQGTSNIGRSEAQKIVSRLCTLLRISHPELLEGSIKRTVAALKDLQERHSKSSQQSKSSHAVPPTGTPLSIEILKRIRKHLEVTYGPVSTSWSDSEVLEALQGCMQGLLRPLEHIQALANVPASTDLIEIAPGVQCSRRDQVTFCLAGLHLQRLLSVASAQGLVPKINEMYLYVGQTNTASTLLRDLLQLNEKDSLGVVVRAVKQLIEEKHGKVPSPMNHVRAESDGYSLLLDESEDSPRNADSISVATTGTTGTTGSTQARLGALANLENQIAALNVQLKLNSKPAGYNDESSITNDTFLDTFDSYSEILPTSSQASIEDTRDE